MSSPSSAASSEYHSAVCTPATPDHYINAREAQYPYEMVGPKGAQCQVQYDNCLADYYATATNRFEQQCRPVALLLQALTLILGCVAPGAPLPSVEQGELDERLKGMLRKRLKETLMHIPLESYELIGQMLFWRGGHLHDDFQKNLVRIFHDAVTANLESSNRLRPDFRMPEHDLFFKILGFRDDSLPHFYILYRAPQRTSIRYVLVKIKEPENLADCRAGSLTNIKAELVAVDGMKYSSRKQIEEYNADIRAYDVSSQIAKVSRSNPPDRRWVCAMCDTGTTLMEYARRNDVFVHHWLKVHERTHSFPCVKPAVKKPVLAVTGLPRVLNFLRGPSVDQEPTCNCQDPGQKAVDHKSTCDMRCVKLVGSLYNLHDSLTRHYLEEHPKCSERIVRIASEEQASTKGSGAQGGETLPTR